MSLMTKNQDTHFHSYSRSCFLSLIIHWLLFLQPSKKTAGIDDSCVQSDCLRPPKGKVPKEGRGHCRDHGSEKAAGIDDSCD